MAKEISSELLNTILTRVGGPGNIASCGNCMTRLRLGVHDSSLVDPDIKTLEGVRGVILTSDQVQVVFGPGKAHRAAKAMSEAAGRSTGTGCRRNRRPEQTSVKSQTNLRRATISRQIRHHLHAAYPRFYCRRSAAGDSDVNCHCDARSGRCLLGHATRRAEFYEGVQQRFVHLPGDSGAITPPRHLAARASMAQLLPHSFCSVITPLQPPVTTPVFTISLVCPSIRAAILSAC